jgi:hypothetical protein
VIRMAEYSIVRARGGRAILALSTISTTTDDPQRQGPDGLPGAGTPARSPDEPPAPGR